MIDETNGRFVQRVFAALELGEGLRELGLADGGAYKRLLVEECALYGRSNDDLDRLDTVNALYTAFIGLATPAERLDTLALVCALVEQGKTKSNALQPFIYMEDDLGVISVAARELVHLYETDDDEDGLGGARFVRKLVDEADDDTQSVGLLRGLLLTGDLRIEPLVQGTWHLLGFGGQQRLAGSLADHANPLTAAFLSEWLQSAEGAERDFVSVALAKVAQGTAEHGA